MNHKTKNSILLIIFIIALINSIILVSINQNPNSEFCYIDEGGNCNSVQGSKYAYTFGISNSVYGVVIFSFMIILTMLHLFKPSKKKQFLINLGVMVGLLIVLYFIFIQTFVLKEFCKYCLLVDIGMIAAFFIVFPDFKKWFKK